MQRSDYSKEQFRFYALTRYKLGINPSDCYKELNIAFSTSSPSKRSIYNYNYTNYNWYGKFKLGEDAPSLKDMHKCGRPRSTKTPKLIALVKELIEEDPKLSVRDLASSRKLWRMLRSNPIHLPEIVWQWDNARPHAAKSVREYMNNSGVTLIRQSPYSPDFNQCDRFLFNWLKSDLQHRQFRRPC